MGMGWVSPLTACCRCCFGGNAECCFPHLRAQSGHSCLPGQDYLLKMLQLVPLGASIGYLSSPLCHCGDSTVPDIGLLTAGFAFLFVLTSFLFYLWLWVLAFLGYTSLKPNLGYVSGQKKGWGIHHSIDLQVFRSLARPPPLHLSQSFNDNLLKCFQGYCLNLEGRSRKNWIYIYFPTNPKSL